MTAPYKHDKKAFVAVLLGGINATQEVSPHP